MNWAGLLQQISNGDIKSLSRIISLIENEYNGYEGFLQLLVTHKKVPVIGVTGPPGAGKSTLVDALVGHYVHEEKKIAVLCIDPSSPFSRGALLGDRVRMSEWYNHPAVYIRSLATRGSLGGLHPKIIEITDVLSAGFFDLIIIETVGVGQSEVEIAGIADASLVVLVPEAGDTIQTMKAGLMEIADIFVVNKADRPGADAFIKNLRLMMAPDFHAAARQKEVSIARTIASQKEGISELAGKIAHQLTASKTNEKRTWLLAEKAYQLIQKKRMGDIDKIQLSKKIEAVYRQAGFNLYRFVNNIP